LPKLKKTVKYKGENYERKWTRQRKRKWKQKRSKCSRQRHGQRHGCKYRKR
jgi:hypothetical protein